MTGTADHTAAPAPASPRGAANRRGPFRAGERVQLTDLLLKLDPSITLILIEHDMDVALRVAQWVTMMHDGRVIVEGTPDDIRGNQTVHDLYLGSGLIHHE